jgi:IS4 transposase
MATTLLDADEYTKDDLAQVYRARWNEELDLRSIKITLQMDLLRCKTPELVRKEIWPHVLAYNLIRTIMAQTASQHKIAPRSISFVERRASWPHRELGGDPLSMARLREQRR